MKSIADHVGAVLGPQASFVSVTVDPEHDSPAALKAFAKEQGAERPGWYFLTGLPAQIDRLMGLFNLRLQHEADGAVDHVLEFFLVGANGRPCCNTLADDTNPAKVARDLEDAIAGKRLADALPSIRQTWDHKWICPAGHVIS